MCLRFLGCFLATLVMGMGQVVSNGQWFVPSMGSQLLGTQGPVMPTGQQPTASTKRYPVSGTVVNALTGGPVARAVVRIQGPEPTQMFTGDDGHFEFKDVPEGRAFLSVQRPGFQSGSNRAVQQQLTVGASTSSIQLKLMPQSSLRGRVVNSEGEPVEGMPIQVFRRQIMNGSRDWVQPTGTNTDETGAYLVENLSPGAYLVRTGGHHVFTMAKPIVVDGQHFPDFYQPQYFPNSPDRASAQPVQIQPGTEAQADFTVAAVPSYSASGSIASTVRGLSGYCESPEGEMVSNAFRMDPRSGQFMMQNLPSGACTLRIQSRSRGGGDAVYGELPLRIGTSDVTGLQLSVEALPDIPILISGGGNSGSPGAQGANIQLVPRVPGFNRPYPIAGQREDGAQVFTAVSPGVYRVLAQVSGGNCLASLTSGSVDLLRSDLTVSPGGSAAPINVALRSDCGSITAKVDGPTASDPVSVVAVPQAAPALARLMMFGGNNVQLSGLTPGDYTIYAAADLTDFAYADPEELKTVTGQKVTVAPNAQLNIQLQLINLSGETR